MFLKNLIITAALTLVVVGFSAAAQNVAQGGQGNHYSAAAPGNNVDGTWWLTFGPPPQRPLILTMNAGGTFVLEDSLDGGGHTTSGASFSLVQGIWTRSGPHSVRALGLRFVYDALGVDAALVKNTAITEHVRLQLRFEAFNVLNTPHFWLPNTAFGNLQFGAINSTTGLPRVLQVSAKLLF